MHYHVLQNRGLVAREDPRSKPGSLCHHHNSKDGRLGSCLGRGSGEEGTNLSPSALDQTVSDSTYEETYCCGNICPNALVTTVLSTGIYSSCFEQGSGTENYCIVDEVTCGHDWAICSENPEEKTVSSGM